jgi:hypothetical protein
MAHNFNEAEAWPAGFECAVLESAMRGGLEHRRQRCRGGCSYSDLTRVVRRRCRLLCLLKRDRGAEAVAPPWWIGESGLAESKEGEISWGLC